MKEKKHIFDDPKNVKRLLVSFFSFLGFLLILDLFVPMHAHFDWEKMPEFYAVFGFVACVCLVLTAKYILRPLVKRDENYYE